MTDITFEQTPRPSATALSVATPQLRPIDFVEPAAIRTTTRRVHVVLPAYNEEGSLGSLLGRLDEVPRSIPLEVWVINDGSTDRTAEVAAAPPATLDVHLVNHPQNRGLGQAVQTGLRSVLAVADDDDVLVVMDADDTHDPALIETMVRDISNGADIAICSRFTAGGDDSTAPRFRRLLSRGAAITFDRFLKLEGVHDFTSGYRAYRVSLLRRAAGHWGERLIEEQGFACMVELLLKLRHCHPLVTEVPLVLQYDRKQGASKLRLGRTLKQYVRLFLRESFAPPPFREV
jgi:dolichol-phosphate mannosyltransferase